MGRQKQRKQHRANRRTKPGKRKRQRSIAPRTAKQFSALSPQFQDRWNRITHTVSKMRADGTSLRKAAKEFGLDPRTVTRWAKPALQKRSNGRYEARSRDTLLRVLTLPSPEGLQEIAVRDSRQASRLGEYWAAAQKYLQTGDASALEKFQGESITAAGRKRVPLLTDLEELNRLGSAGALSFESLYAKAA